MGATREVSSHPKSSIAGAGGDGDRSTSVAAAARNRHEHEAGMERGHEAARKHRHHAEAKHRHAGKRRHGHHHKRRKHKHRVHHKHLGAVTPALPSAPSSPPSPSSAPPPARLGPLSEAWANRLLWRAGFGPRPGDVQALTGKRIEAAVLSLTRPSGPANLVGPEPVEEEGHPLDPIDAWGQDHCWWLDRMIRSDQQLIERMTFIWHDWFANSNEQVGSQKLMLEQNELFREMALGSFHDLFLAVTTNPAMLIFLNGTSNTKWDPNENYAREMMELFSLGADRGPTPRPTCARWHGRSRAGPTNGPLNWATTTSTTNLQPRRRSQDDLRPDEQLRLRRRCRALRQTPAPSLVLRHQAVGVLHPHARPTKRPSPRCEGIYRAAASDQAGRRGDPPAPGLLRRA